MAEGASLGAVTLDLVTGVAFDVAVGGAIGNLFRFARSLVKIRSLATSVAAFRAARPAGSIWSLAPFARGWAAELKIFGTRWLHASFPVIDDWNRARRAVTSIKSLDLTAASYQTGSRIRSQILRAARQLSGFNGARFAGVTITPADISRRVLVFAFENGAASRVQARVLRQVAREIKRVHPNVDLVFQWFPG